MTKKEAIESLKEIKVQVISTENSRKIQEKLFSLGFSWYETADNPTTVSNLYCPFLYTDSDKNITCNSNLVQFERSTNKYVSYNAILNIEIEYFQPFQKALVRDSSNGIWKPELFGFIDSKAKEYKYICCGGSAFKQCIPYEGNEELLGTTKSPK